MYTTLVVFITFLTLFVWYLKRRNDYWKTRKVPHENARLLVGNMWEVLTNKKHMGLIFHDHYKKFSDAKYCGVMNFGLPTLLVRDPEILEKIFIRDFSKFRNNGIFINEKKDPVLSKNPFFAKDDHWKALRQQLTPQLSPLKIKNMFPLMKDVKDRMITYLKEHPNFGKNTGIDLRDLSLRYTTEMVASCAFGLYGNCFNDDKAEITQITKKLFNPSAVDITLALITAIFPILNDICTPQFLKTDVTKWFEKLIVNTLKERQEKNIRRGDFLDAIAEMKEKTTSFEYTTEYMIAHATSFFIDGSLTTASTLQYALYELGKNEHIQEELRKKLKSAVGENDGKHKYDILHNIEYLDMVILETLRVHPNFFLMVKECTESVSLPPSLPGDSEFVVEKGTKITIPTYSINRDPRYYEEPEKFVPERFTTDAIAARPKMTFFGFSDGPRVCIGRRFALAVLKIALFGILTNFKIEVNDTTPEKLEIDHGEFLYATKGPLAVNLYPLHS